MKRLFVVTSALGWLVTATPACALGNAAAKALVQEFRLTTYTATRRDSDFYDLMEGYVVKTKYCYVYAYSENVVVTRNKIIFIDSNDACDVEGVYRK